MNNPKFIIKKMVSDYANGGYLLITVTIVAMILANSPVSEDYFAWWEQPVSFGIGNFNLFSHGGVPLSFIDFINDALMAIFFFSVGLEIKREVLVGELSSIKQSLLPVIAACGGMIVPILIFFAMESDPEILRGSAIPMATDIAFSLGVLTMLGKRVPIGLKIFLATLAVVDDIGGIFVIAFCYSSHTELVYLLYAAALIFVIIWGARQGIRNNSFYSLLGVAVWYTFLHSGIHSTIAGVVVALCIPARPAINTHHYIQRIKDSISHFPDTTNGGRVVSILTNKQINILKSVEDDSDCVISPLQNMEDFLHPLVNWLVIPLFAFANAGVNLDGLHLYNIFEGVSLSILVSLLAGKFIGIFSFSYLAIKSKIVTLPHYVTMKMIAAVSILGGIGFTVSIFIANLSYSSDVANHEALLREAKLGIIAASTLAGVLGYFILKYQLPKEELSDCSNHN